MSYVMQARSSTSGDLITWLTAAADFAGAEFPGPGSPEHIAVASAPDGAVGAGEANTTSNVGTGEGTLAKTKVGVDLPIKTLKAGTNITLTNNADDVTIDAAGGGGSSAGSSGQVQTSDGAGGFSAPTNFLAGANFWSIGVNPATTGAGRLANDTALYWRNSANTANVRGIRVDAGGGVIIGEDTNATQVQLRATTFHQLYVGATLALDFRSKKISLGVDGTDPSITQGSGAPAAAFPNGSIYLRTDGSVVTGIYTRQGGAWAPLGSPPAAAAIGALDIDWAASSVHTKTLAAGGNAFTFSNAASGMVISVRLTANAGGSTATWPAMKWAGDAAPTWTAGKARVITLMHDGATIIGVASDEYTP